MPGGVEGIVVMMGGAAITVCNSAASALACAIRRACSKTLFKVFFRLNESQVTVHIKRAHSQKESLVVKRHDQ